MTMTTRWRLLGWTALLLLACRREPGGTARPRGPLAAATVRDGGVAISPDRLHLVPQRDVLAESFSGHEQVVFDPRRPRVGWRTREACAVWSFSDGAYVGQTTAASCAEWRETCAEERAPDGKRTLKIADGALLLRPSATAEALRIAPQTLAPGCRAIETARWSPDGQRVAVSCDHGDQVYVLDAAKGQRLATLSLDGDLVQSMCWGAPGLTVLTSPAFGTEQCSCALRPLHPAGDEPPRLPGDVCEQTRRQCQTQELHPPLAPKSLPCPHPAQLRLSPSRRQLAVACDEQRKLFVIDAASGAVIAQEGDFYRSNEADLCWKGDALFLLGSQADAYTARACRYDDPNFDFGTLRLFAALDAPPRVTDLDPTKQEQRADPRSQFFLDPLGRFLLQRNDWRAGSEVRSLDIATGQRGPLDWTVYDNARPPYGLLRVRWLPGKYPLFEAIEATGSQPPYREYRLWRISTAPGARGLSLVTLGDQAPAARCRVLDDGKTVVAEPGPPDLGPADDYQEEPERQRAALDPSGRFRAIDWRTLKRLSDEEELYFDRSGGARTAAGLFDGSIELVSSLVFRQGEDAATAAVVRGDQLAPLLYHARLINDFFDGKPLAPTRLAEPLGRAPHLVELAVDPLPGAAGLRFRVRAEDGGDGVGLLHRWVEGREQGPPLPVTAGQTIELAVPLPADRCALVRLYACNRLGLLCSPAVRRDHCPVGAQRPERTWEDP